MYWFIRIDLQGDCELIEGLSAVFMEGLSAVILEGWPEFFVEEVIVARIKI